jgi:galactokinase/mevalonate kinase-like predicted kinase
MALALAEGDLAAVAGLLARNWRLQRRLDPAMETAGMAALEVALRRAGSLGGKAAGAGAGGTMFFVLDRGSRDAIRVARELGATILPLRWAKEGVRVW